MSRAEADVRKEHKQRIAAVPKTKKTKPSTAKITGGNGAGTPPPSGPFGGPSAAGGAPAPKGKTAVAAVLVGREPRVDLLPTEVHVDRKERATARRAWLGVVVVAAVVVLGIAGATLNSARSATDLASAQSQTTTLLARQQKYAEVRTVEQQTNLIEAGQEVGGATEIDWKTYLGDLRDSLPSGVTITGLTIDSATPMQAIDQASGPLEGSRVAAIKITLSSATIPTVPELTESLSSLKGYVDSSITSITQSSDGAGYDAAIELHVNQKAFDHKYSGKD